MKNVSLVPEIRDGRATFYLVGPDGKRLASFDVFARLFDKHSIHTRKAYLRNLARFFDYLFEASEYLRQQGEALTHDNVVRVLAAYQEYLVYGLHSGNELAKEVASTLSSPMVSDGTCTAMHAPVRRFLKLSDSLRKQMEELHRNGLSSLTVDPMPILPLLASRAPSQFERTALYRNSMIASVVSGGPRLLQDAGLPSFGGPSQYQAERAFPFDCAVALIEAMPSWRDKALYAFCAASGCRISEAMQMLWSDISKGGVVKLVDPTRRSNDASYLALQPKERDKLVWKGRTIEATLLIEPFASLFFEALEMYVRKEYVPHGKHQFVFQHLRKGFQGQAYFLSAASSRGDIFNKAVMHTVQDESKRDLLGVHSLRHMYGTYLLNYFPRIDGSYGLPIGTVRQLMGHKSVANTEKYARHDLDLMATELAFANAMVFGNTGVKSLNEMKKQVLEQRLAQVQVAIELEEISPAPCQRIRHD